MHSGTENGCVKSLTTILWHNFDSIRKWWDSLQSSLLLVDGKQLNRCRRIIVIGSARKQRTLSNFGRQRDGHKLTIAFQFRRIYGNDAVISIRCERHEGPEWGKFLASWALNWAFHKILGNNRPCNNDESIGSWRSDKMALHATRDREALCEVCMANDRWRWTHCEWTMEPSKLVWKLWNFYRCRWRIVAFKFPNAWIVENCLSIIFVDCCKLARTLSSVERTYTYCGKFHHSFKAGFFFLD